MCNGASAIALQVGGGLQKAAGAYMKTSGEKRKLQGDADIADLNARLSDLSAKSTLRQGQREEQRSRFETTNTKDAQQTAFAGNGIALDSETAVRIMTSTDVLGEIDANTINANAARAAWGYRMEGVQFRNEALTKRATASSLNPALAATSSLINSAGNVAESYTRLKRAGAFDKKDSKNRGSGRGFNA